MKNHYIEIQSLLGAHKKLSVAYQFMFQMGDKIIAPPKYKIDISKLLNSCIGIHRTFCETNNCKETYHQVKNISLLKDGKRLISRYEIVNCDNNTKTLLENKGYNIITFLSDEGETKYYWEEEILMMTYKPSKLDYYTLASKLREIGIWYFTDGEKYKTFISSDPLHISTESIIYNLMFFFGSITRYHPYMFDSLLSDKQMWLISEFLKTQPKQFLHIVTSKTIECAILKPNTANILY